MAPNPLARSLASPQPPDVAPKDDRAPSPTPEASDPSPLTIPLDRPHAGRLGKRSSYVVTAVVLCFYVGFFWQVSYEYRTRYFLQETSPAKMPNYLQQWVPLLACGVLLEAFFALLKGETVYSTGEAICSLSYPVARMATNRVLWMTFLAYGSYGVVWDLWGASIHAAVFPVWFQQSSWLQIAAMVLLDDFMYYWAHRFGHTINLFWALHQVHHQPERLNLASGMRNSLIVRWGTIWFFLPLALLFDPPLFIILRQFNLMYQYWIHNDLIGKLGWLEYILNTPSQHRVHHGRNAYCIDKNYGGLLSVFDRLFGTFQEELEDVPPVFGLTTSLNTLDVWKLNWQPIVTLLKTCWEVPGWKAKCGVLWHGPGRIPGSQPPAEYEIPPVTQSSFQFQEPLFTGGLKALLIFEVVLTTLVFLAINRRFATEPDNFWYLLVVNCYCGWAMYATSLLSNRPGYSYRLQVLTVATGVALFSFGAIMQNGFGLDGTTLLRIAVYLVVGGALAGTIRMFKREMETPLGMHEVARDLPFAKEAEDAQWAHHRRNLEKLKAN